MTAYGIHWFRRDLRLAGNPALRENLARHNGRVLGLFCFDSKFLSRPDFSHNRFAFFMKTMEALREEMRTAGGELLVIDGLPHEAFPKIFKHVKAPPALVSFNRDYEPYAIKRDEAIVRLLEKSGIEALTARDHLILEPHEVLKEKDKGFYQIYTPFSKRWAERFATAEIQSRVHSKACGLEDLKKIAGGRKSSVEFNLHWRDVKAAGFPYKEALKDFQKENDKHVTVEIPPAGSAAAFARLKEFQNPLEDYKTDRDVPSRDGTSKLSMYFKNGSLTTAQVIAHLGLADENIKKENSRSRYLKELIWREFYYSILWNAPRVEGEAFIEKYKDLKWENDKTKFRRWCEGRTGYPIVDAGMRQLNTTGWMHNRVRMIVASFLTKDLLIDWRWGENYFMKTLLDGDLAPNNGGWQWAASTGCDPQPYFRVFNPYLQSEKFDPEGEYIRTYVEELAHVKDDNIHYGRDVKGYPEPIVNHATAKTRAIALYKNAKV